MDMFLEGLKTVLESCGSLIIILVGAFAVFGLRMLCKKLGIELKDTDYETIISIVKQVIKYLDQIYTDAIKKNSKDGKLTDQQKDIIKGKALEMLRRMLTAEQVQYLLDKYHLSDIDEILDLLIESTIVDARKDALNGGIIINEESLTEIMNQESETGDSKYVACSMPDEFDLQSLAICSGDCTTCGLHCDWCRCSKCKEKLI